jgi:hypothetical protein
MKWSARHDIDDKVCAQPQSINKYMTKTKNNRFSLFSLQHDNTMSDIILKCIESHFMDEIWKKYICDVICVTQNEASLTNGLIFFFQFQTKMITLKF